MNPNGRFLDCFQSDASNIQALGRADNFLHQSVRHAIERARIGPKYQRFELDASLIVEPLTKLMREPDKSILVRLIALEVRYSRFRLSDGFTRGERFSVDTPFLELVNEHRVKTTAERLTKAAKEGFLALSASSVLRYNEPVRMLGHTWDQLAQDARELAAADSFHEKLILLAKASF